MLPAQPGKFGVVDCRPICGDVIVVQALHAVIGVRH